jgi:ABC-type multidrug transport system ATPase subunit
MNPVGSTSSVATSVAGHSLLNVSGLSKRYGDLWALQNASFSVRAGEVLGLIGPNGSGKTTLFECLAGVIPATAGRVAAGQRVLSPRERKETLFYVPDGIRPWPDQTVGWVLRFIAGLHGTDAAKRTSVIHALALDDFLDSRTSSLSKGENKRVLLALGLLSPQPILLLDEPFDGLDLRQTRDVIRVLREHAARGRTLFLSIHQLTDAARVCDRLVLLSGGELVAEGALDELRERSGAEPGSGLDEVFLALT